MSYMRIDVDLTEANKAKQLVKRGTPYTFVALAVAPLDADVSLSMGNGADPFPFVKGAGWRGDPCAPEVGGLYITNSAQPGTTITIYVGLASELVSSS